MRRSTFLAGSAALAAAAAAEPAGAQFNPNQPFLQQLTIGVSVPLSGDLKAYGIQISNGARAAVDEHNRYVAPLERVFAVRTFDDQDALAIGMTNVQIAAADSTIVAMIGNLTADVTVGSLPQYANASMPLVVPASTANAITAKDFRNVYRLPTKDTTEGALCANMLLPMLKPTFALAVAQDGDYGSDVAQGFTAAARAATRTDTFVFPVEKPDYAAAAKAIVAQHADLIFLCGKTAAMGPLIPELHALGYTGSWAGSDGFFNDATIKQYGPILKGAWVASSMPPLQRAPLVFQALSDFQGQYGTITALAAYGYAAAQIIMAAVKRSNATTRVALLEAMQLGGTYDTIIGQFSFTFIGDPVDPNLYFYSVGDSSFKYEKAARPTTFLV
jgi:branched-chain amino acid transport system substrate-binding protein